jgi:hypothetical protein
MWRFFFFVLTTAFLNAATYNVPGDYANINDALAVAQPGDTVFTSGVHDYDINTVRAGSSGSLITIDGQDETTIRQMNFNHPYVRLQSVLVKGKATTYAASIWFWQGAHYCEVSDCVIDNEIFPDLIGIGWKLGSGKPFSTAGDTASNCKIQHCVIRNVANTAALSISGDDNLFAYNTVIDGAEVDWVRIFGRRNIIRGNTFRNNYLHPDWSNHPDFIQVFGNDGVGSMDHIIEGNLIDGVEGGGLSQMEANLVPEIEDFTFQNNIFMNISNTASCSVANVKYFNNLFYRCNYGNGGHPLTFGSRSYAQNRVDPSVPAYAQLGYAESGDLVEGGAYFVYMLTPVTSGNLVAGTQYVVDGTSSGYITYNGTNYGRRAVFTADATTTFTTSGSMSVYRNGTITYNGVVYNHNTNFIGTSNPNFTTNQYDPTVRIELFNRAHGATVKGNVFLECGDSGTNRGWYSISNELTGVSADYNYVAKAGFAPVAVDSLQRDIGGPVPWDAQAAKWWEDHGINGNNSDPGFISHSTFDWRLLTSSILKDTGVTIAGLTTDRLGVTRPQGAAFDIGPFEYNSGSPPPGTAPTAPSAPAAVSLGTTSIRLSWTDNSSDEDYFTVERSLNGSSWFSAQTTLPNIAATDITGLQPNTTYYFRLRAGNAYGVSSWTSTVNATTDADLPTVVAIRTVLQWDARPVDEQITKYEVFERTGQGPVYGYVKIGETTNLYMSVTPVRGGNFWVVRAVNTTAAGPYSDPGTFFVQGLKSRRPRGRVPIPIPFLR